MVCISIEYTGSIKKWLPEIDWIRFEPGEVPELKQAVSLATAYLRFKSSETALKFSREMDGAAYRDCAGRLTKGEVEWAAIQRIPSSKQKKDHRQGGIEEDALYKAWLTELTAEKAPLLSAEQQLEAKERAERGKKKGIVITPLMQYLKDKQAKKLEKAEREKRQKQQAALRERQLKLLQAQQEAREAAKRKLAAQSAAKSGKGKGGGKGDDQREKGDGREARRDRGEERKMSCRSQVRRSVIFLSAL